MTEITREELDARLETIETRMDGRIGLLEAKMDVKFAELRIEMQKGFADMTKWIVGVFIAAVVANVTIMTFVLNHATPKAASAAPAAIYYVQPVIPSVANQATPSIK